MKHSELKAKTQNLKWYLSAEVSRFLNCCLRGTFIFLWLVCLHYSNTNLCFLLTWVYPCMTFQNFAWIIFVFCTKLSRPALKMHVLWCKTSIYSWNFSEEVSLMYEDSFSISLLCNLKYVSLYFIQNTMKSSCKWLIPFTACHIS